jgi:hypothetical protein
MTKYFLICASKDHILLGINQGIAQAGHGRKDFISKPSKGDWIVYYSWEKIQTYRRNVDYKPCNEAKYARPLKT